jgi:hypothetical protein
MLVTANYIPVVPKTLGLRETSFVHAFPPALKAKIGHRGTLTYFYVGEVTILTTTKDRNHDKFLLNHRNFSTDVWKCSSIICHLGSHLSYFKNTFKFDISKCSESPFDQSKVLTFLKEAVEATGETVYHKSDNFVKYACIQLGLANETIDCMDLTPSIYPSDITCMIHQTSAEFQRCSCYNVLRLAESLRSTIPYDSASILAV